MGVMLFANNADTTLASPINTVATTLQVVSGAGAEFPNPTGGDFFRLTLTDAATGTINEIMTCTARAGDVLTVIRGQEGTVAASWAAGDAVRMDPTAGTMQNLSQVVQTQAGAPNYAVDTGTPNSYVAAFSPPITGRVPGMRLYIEAANSNSGPSTLNVGAGSVSITNPDGSALGQGAIITGGVFEVIDLGSGPYQLISSSQQAQSLSGAFTTGGFQWRPTNETLTGWVPANTLTIGNASSNATGRANADTANLYAWHWNNFSNTQCPVFTSAGVPTTRGANAAADFAANKAIQTYDMRGRGAIGVDTMGGPASTFLNNVPVVSGNATTPGSVLGENLHTLITAELAAHTHGNTFNASTHAHSYTVVTFPGGPGPGPGGSTTIGSAGSTTGSSTTGDSITNASAGSNGAHNNVGLNAAGTWYIKL